MSAAKGRGGLVLVAIASLLLTGLAPAAAVDGTGTATVEGVVHRLAIELPDSHGVEITLVVPEDSTPLRVEEGALEDVPSGSEVKVEVVDLAVPDDPTDPSAGARVEDLQVLQGPDTSESTATTDEGAPLALLERGSRPVHLVTATIGGQAPDSVTPSQLATEMTSRVAPYWADSTGGAFTFTAGTRVSGGSYGAWGSTTTCTSAQIFGLLEWSGRAAGAWPTAGHARHSMVYTPELRACGFLGVAHVADGGSAWINGETQSSQRWITVAHELGHTLTLGHSNSRIDCGSAGDRADGSAPECHEGEYADAYDIMGSGAGGVGPLSGANLDRLGLLSAASTVRATQPTTVTLAPVGGLDGRRFLRFTSSGVVYHVEYRGAVGRDADLATSRIGCPAGIFFCSSAERYRPGVLVRRVSSDSGGDTHLLDAGRGDPAFRSTDAPFVLPVGRTFTTRDSAWRVKVVSTSSSGARIELSSGAVAPPSTSPQTPFAQIVLSSDLTGDRYADVVTVDRAGRLFIYPGRGNGTLRSRQTLGTGWGSMSIYAPGDWNGDGRNDLVATDAAGRLYLYPGNGAGGFGSRRQIGHGWSTYRIVPAGDVNGDRKADLLAMDSAGRLWLYPGNGKGGFARRIQVGKGWAGYDLHAAGDMNRDGRADIVSIDSRARLWFYAGRGGGHFQPKVQVGRGWGGYRFASGADLNGDRINDLLGRDSSGRLWFYAGRPGGSYAGAVRIATGW